MSEERNFMLCVGGPLDGRRYASDKSKGFVVAVSEPISALEAAAWDYTPNQAVDVIRIEYHAETFHTPQGDVAFWVPVGQKPLETISKLAEHYRPPYVSPSGFLPRKGI